MITYAIVAIIATQVLGFTWLIINDGYAYLFNANTFLFEVNTFWDFIQGEVSIIYVIKRMLHLSGLYLSWSALYFGLKFWRDLSAERERIHEAKRLAQNSKLQMLKYQLNPHFLFNSLNSIQTLIYQNPKQADKMIASLSEFLRYNLDYADKLEIQLIEEVNIIKQYLLIEKNRFEERLEYKIEVSKETEKLKILAFIIQPFVENAVKYGMRTNPEEMKLNLSTFLKDEELNIEIDNSGEWLANSGENGMGIRNVRERLINAYPGQHKLLISADEGWVRISIKINMEALNNLEVSNHKIHDSMVN